jgi:membrane-bound metal-dependent hydrolase YbcI (DUF457 family)
MLIGDPVLHGATHTMLVASLIGGIAALIGKPISEFTLKLLRSENQVITWRASISGAFLGTYSHVLLDSVMHADMRPFMPWSDRNPMLDLVPVPDLHAVCLWAGVLGAMLLLVRHEIAR